MDARTAGALRRRIVAQGWDQGSRLPFTRRLVLADPTAPVSPLTVAALGDRPPVGSGPVAVLQHPSEQVGSIVVTQLCDLAADPAAEPNVEALPVVRWPTDSPLPQPNSCRHLVLDEDRRLVADATCRLVFEKPLLPDEAAVPMLASPQDRRRFAAWLGRRATRAPFPDDFEATVATALRKVLAGKQHAEHEVARTMGLWRVGLHGQASPQVSLLIPYDERRVDRAAAQAFVDAVMREVGPEIVKQADRARRHLGRLGRADVVRDFEVVARAAPMDEISMRLLAEMPPLNLEALTYPRGAIVGAEPHPELER